MRKINARYKTATGDFLKRIKIIRNFIKLCIDNFNIQEPIYEFGSLQPERKNLRPLFPGKKFVGCDIREGTGVDKIIDITDTGLPDSSVGTVITLDTLEHVKYVWKAPKECLRILKPNGLLIVSVPFMFHLHNHPSDYWRFTEEGLKTLMEDFTNVFVAAKTPNKGGIDVTKCVVGVGFNGELPKKFNIFKKKMEIWKK